MKTAVSLPDSLFEATEQAAARWGIPRSQLVALALEEFLQKHEADSVTERLNRVYGTTPSAEAGREDASLQRLRELTKNDAW